MWTLAELRVRPFIRRAEKELFELMRRAGKNRFQAGGVERDPVILPFSNGYLVYLVLSHPECDAVYLHELLHGILLEEGYPLAHSDRILRTPKITAEVLENSANCIQHVEIFRRMREYGADMDGYFARRAEETTVRVQRVIEWGDWDIAVRHLDPLVLFDTYFMGERGLPSVPRTSRMPPRSSPAAGRPCGLSVTSGAIHRSGQPRRCPPSVTRWRRFATRTSCGRRASSGRA